jgi:tetraacyldisaccharide 4'-kinase
MKFFLFFGSLFYRAGCQAKNHLYDWKILRPKKAPLTVISIGNIAFGGTEKTPLVMNLISFLTQYRFKPALISRGYKGKWEKKGGVLSNGKSLLGTWIDSGDEAFMVAQNIPQSGVFIGKNRLKSCLIAKDLSFAPAILDDGFQHRRLHRDLDIVLFNPSEKLALREPVSSLKRAHIVLIKKGINTQRQKIIKNLIPQTPTFEYDVIPKAFFDLNSKELVPEEEIKGKKVLAFCGIARPRRFASLLQEKGLKIATFLEFPDHHSYPPSSLEKIVEKCQKAGAESLITTEKDAVKISGFKGLKKIPVYYLKIDIQLEEEFYSRVLSLLQSNK